MTSKQLTKLAKSHGWTMRRNGRKHMVWEREGQTVALPYQVRSCTAPLYARKLTTCAN